MNVKSAGMCKQDGSGRTIKQPTTSTRYSNPFFSIKLPLEEGFNPIPYALLPSKEVDGWVRHTSEGVEKLYLGCDMVARYYIDDELQPAVPKQVFDHLIKWCEEYELPYIYNTDKFKEVPEVQEYDVKNSDVLEPEHYISEGKVETIDAMWSILENDRHTGFGGYCLGNVIKYVSRAGLKPGSDYIEDIEKALVYFLWFIEDAEQEHAVDILEEVLESRKTLGEDR